MAKTHEGGGTSAAVSSKQRSGRRSRPRKHVPLRTCIACRQTGSKRELIRVVRAPGAGVQVDVTGKLTGRGAYLCRNRSCWERGLRSQQLNQALKTTLTSEEIANLWTFAATLPEAVTRREELVESTASSEDHV